MNFRAVLLAVALGTSCVTPGVALAQTAPTKLTLSADPRMDGRGRPVKGQLILSATLTNAAGKPINNKAVNFYQQVELMGQHDAFIGTASTDATGVAALLYEPAQSGPQQLKARFPGGPTSARRKPPRPRPSTTPCRPSRASLCRWAPLPPGSRTAPDCWWPAFGPCC